MEASLSDITASRKMFLLFVTKMDTAAHTARTIGVSRCQHVNSHSNKSGGRASARRKTDALNLPPSSHVNWLAGGAAILSRRKSKQGAPFTHCVGQCSSSAHNACLYPYRRQKKAVLFSWNQKTPRIQVKAPIFYSFTLRESRKVKFFLLFFQDLDEEV